MTLPTTTIRIRIALATLILLSAPAAAAWVKVDAHGGIRFFVDPATLRRAGDVVKVWELVDFRSTQVRPDLKPFRSIRRLAEYDCRDDVSRQVTLSLHAGNMALGEIVHADADYGLWRPVPPGTAAENVLKMVCGRK